MNLKKQLTKYSAFPYNELIKIQDSVELIIVFKVLYHYFNKKRFKNVDKWLKLVILNVIVSLHIICNYKSMEKLVI